MTKNDQSGKSSQQNLSEVLIRNWQYCSPSANRTGGFELGGRGDFSLQIF
jgi:hypothetical protein